MTKNSGGPWLGFHDVSSHRRLAPVGSHVMQGQAGRPGTPGTTGLLCTVAWVAVGSPGTPDTSGTPGPPGTPGTTEGAGGLTPLCGRAPTKVAAQTGIPGGLGGRGTGPVGQHAAVGGMGQGGGRGRWKGLLWQEMSCICPWLDLLSCLARLLSSVSLGRNWASTVCLRPLDHQDSLHNSGPWAQVIHWHQDTVDATLQADLSSQWP